MNQRGKIILGAFLVGVALFAALVGPEGRVVPAAMAQTDESSYWTRFKAIFVDWNDNAQPGTAQTEVCGVRGVDIEQNLGDEGYDWDAVLYMEEFQVGMEAEKQFLQEGKLGPYQGR